MLWYYNILLGLLLIENLIDQMKYFIVKYSINYWLIQNDVM